MALPKSSHLNRGDWTYKEVYSDFRRIPQNLTPSDLLTCMDNSIARGFSGVYFVIANFRINGFFNHHFFNVEFPKSSAMVGERVGSFTVLYNSKKELVLEQGNSLMLNRISFFIQANSKNQKELIVCNVVKTKGLFGKVSYWGIRYWNKLLLSNI